MGTLVGHVAPGIGFILIGLWHLINHIKLHTTNHPKPYTSPPWFGRPELYLIMAGSALSVAMELFVGPANHQPLDPSDGSIPSNHLHNFEHSSISLAFFTYASLSLVLDRLAIKSRLGLSQLLAALAFGQQFLLFHLHSADHVGPEGQYHLLLQIVVFVSLLTTLLGLGFPESFLLSFVRSLSVLFQGVWFVLMGFVLWTPSLVPKGCFMHYERGHHVVRCSGEESLHRAKSLVNLQFSWFLTGVAIFGICLYVVLGNVYENGHKVEYFSLGLIQGEEEEENMDENIDVESQKKSKAIVLNESTSNKSFINDMGKSGFVKPMDMER